MRQEGSQVTFQKGHLEEKIRQQERNLSPSQEQSLEAARTVPETE